MNFKITGELYDKLTNVKTGEVTTFYGKNIIVTKITELIAALMKNAEGISGITYWENGSGLDSWDDSLPDPTVDDEACVTPLYRKAVNPVNIIYVDADGNESVTRTNRIKVSIAFSEEESNGDLREIALYGGDATSVLSSGIIIDHKNHAIITKTIDMTLDRDLFLTFSLA